MVEESKYCTQVMKKHFNKDLVIIKEDDSNFESSVKCWIYHNTLVEDDIKVKDHFHMTRKFRDTVHKDCSIKVSLSYEIAMVLHNLKIMMHILLCKNLKNSILK